MKEVFKKGNLIKAKKGFATKITSATICIIYKIKQDPINNDNDKIYYFPSKYETGYNSLWWMKMWFVKLSP